MRLVPLACALLIVLAGCGGVLQTPTPTATEPDETATPTSSITVIGGEYPVDAEAVFERVLNMTEEAVDAPVLYIEEPDAEEPAILDRSVSPFRTALGIVPPERTNDSGTQLGAYTPADGNSVHVYEGVLENETYAESTLAHEFVHTVQFRTDWGSRAWDAQPRVSGHLTYDGRLAYYLLIEGAASFVQHHYEEQFLPNAPESEAFGQARYENASAHARLNLARYVLGAQYVADRIDSPGDLATLHDDPPVSSEQVLHRNDDSVAYLSIDANDVGEWESRYDRNTQGELFIRVVLRTELNRSAAVAGADGWGNDRRIGYDNGNATGTAWVLRWDDAANATEFEETFRRYLDAKATTDDGVWQQGAGNASYRLQRLTNRTTVVYLGNESFVRAANATGDTDGFVTIEAGNGSAASIPRPQNPKPAWSPRAGTAIGLRGSSGGSDASL